MCIFLQHHYKGQRLRSGAVKGEITHTTVVLIEFDVLIEISLFKKVLAVH